MPSALSLSLRKGLTSVALATALSATPALAQSPPPMSAYAEQYPLDAVRGVPFFQHPAVRAAVEAAVPDPAIRSFLMDQGNVVTPLRETRGRYLNSGYDRASDGDANWAILLVADGSKAAVCFSFGVEQDVRGADWYIDGQRAFTLYMRCATKPADIDAELGDWPIGGIPG